MRPNYFGYAEKELSEVAASVAAGDTTGAGLQVRDMTGGAAGGEVERFVRAMAEAVHVRRLRAYFAERDRAERKAKRSADRPGRARPAAQRWVAGAG